MKCEVSLWSEMRKSFKTWQELRWAKERWAEIGKFELRQAEMSLDETEKRRDELRRAEISYQKQLQRDSTCHLWSDLELARKLCFPTSSACSFDEDFAQKLRLSNLKLQSLMGISFGSFLFTISTCSLWRIQYLVWSVCFRNFKFCCSAPQKFSKFCKRRSQFLVAI